jgi:hypothetical protein
LYLDDVRLVFLKRFWCAVGLVDAFVDASTLGGEAVGVETVILSLVGFSGDLSVKAVVKCSVFLVC